MTPQEEAMITIAIYIFFATCLSLPFIVARLYYKANRTINKANKILDYVQSSEEDSRKYRDN